MTPPPTPEEIAKLPKWAQDHLRALQRERDESTRISERFTNEQTVQPICVPEHACNRSTEGKGPSFFKHYVEGTSIEINWQGIHLRISLHKQGNMHDNCIHLSWENIDGTPQEERGCAFVPSAHNQAQIFAKKHIQR